MTTKSFTAVILLFNELGRVLFLCENDVTALPSIASYDNNISNDEILQKIYDISGYEAEEEPLEKVFKREDADGNIRVAYLYKEIICSDYTRYRELKEPKVIWLTLSNSYYDNDNYLYNTALRRRLINAGFKNVVF